ncbi:MULTISPECIES: hypothetical protein [Marinobacter]|uniref:DUF995 domain-containing protein n=1 Tax=Marinobacter suaedae TaxID=3057675 RepID=A0ABT8W100_9GAMM|nr:MULTISPECIES: hypothetical protein [unclassified Marinobacter]MBZ2169916.1 hypothetical protein [Marinobacter sp. F4216]MDO3721896.1 hypothetical protein [Marinobacter sp. chi1]
MSMEAFVAPVRLLVVCIACFWGSSSAGQEALLDGASFAGVLWELTASYEGDADWLVFSDGRLVSQACQDYGFEGAEYRAFREDGLVHFEATAVSPKHGTMVWKGIRNGNRIEASVVWTKERWYWWDLRREYLFTGHHIGQ